MVVNFFILIYALRCGSAAYFKNSKVVFLVEPPPPPNYKLATAALTTVSYSLLQHNII